MAVVTIVMGSKSDYETVLPAYEILRKLGVDAEMKVMSAHRTPDEVAEFAKNAAECKTASFFARLLLQWF